MAAMIARRLNLKLNPSLLLLLHNHPKPYRTTVSNPIPNNPQIHNPFKSTPTFFNPHIRFSSTTPEAESGQTKENPDPNLHPHLKHQEIEGPTVERDLSALANETRASLDALTRAVYGLSRVAAALGLAHLGAGAWLAYAGDAATASPEAAAAMVVHVAGFAFPFSLAFLLRRSLKPIMFFRKMEEQGRLQILTLSLQAFKHLEALFARVRGISITCLLGLSVGVLYALFFSK